MHHDTLFPEGLSSVDLVSVDGLVTEGILMGTEGCHFFSFNTSRTHMVNLQLLGASRTTAPRHWEGEGVPLPKFLSIQDLHKPCRLSQDLFIGHSLPTPWPTVPRSLDLCPVLATLPNCHRPGPQTGSSRHLINRVWL